MNIKERLFHRLLKNLLAKFFRANITLVFGRQGEPVFSVYSRSLFLSLFFFFLFRARAKKVWCYSKKKSESVEVRWVRRTKVKVLRWREEVEFFFYYYCYFSVCFVAVCWLWDALLTWTWKTRVVYKRWLFFFCLIVCWMLFVIFEWSFCL